MDNVLEDMVQRLRAIELLIRTQNDLLTRMLSEMEQLQDGPRAGNKSDLKNHERIRPRA
jgi:hypothetical protein